MAETPAVKAGMRNACGGCPTTWTGQSRAHCAGCHRTFSTARLFDLHRSASGERGTCLDPEKVTSKDGERLLLFRGGMWCGPEMTEEQKARAFGTGDAA